MSQAINIVKFNIELLPSILYFQFTSNKPTDFTSLDLSEVDEDEQKHPLALLAGLKGSSQSSLNLEKLLLVKLAHGIADGVYGASLYRESSDSNELVIKFGQNVFPVTPKGKEIFCGNFVGEFVWETKQTTDGRTYQKVWLELVSEEDPFTYYIVPLAIPRDITIQKPLFTAALNNGLGIAQFLKPVPVQDGSGFSHTFSLEDLEIGEYLISKIRQYKKSDTTYGVFAYKIFLEGEFSVWAKGKSLVQMGQSAEEKGKGESNKAFHVLAGKIDSGIPYKLSIVDKREYENATGKHWVVTHAIVRGVPTKASPELPKEGVSKQIGADAMSFDWVAFAQSLGLTLERVDEIQGSGLVEKIINTIDVTLPPPQKHAEFKRLMTLELIAIGEETGITEIPASALPF